MEFKNFSYIKKKDGETKGYLVLVMEDGENHIGGLDVGKLDDEEIKDALSTAIKIETLERIWRQETKRDLSIEEMLEADPSKKLEIEPLRENLHRYIKKAYRKYLKSNIQDPIVEDSLEEE